MFYNTYISRYRYPKSIFDSNIELYKKLYDLSDTFLDFFIKLNKIVDKKEKCKFFKSWLYDFIASKILIERTWYIDLFPKIEVVSNITTKTSRKNQTRRKNKN